MQNSKISIIVPVYNAQNFITNCINSLTKQTITNIEIICVNDGSKDNSLQVLEGLAAKDNRIKVINQENKGICGARNTGLRNTTGDFITFIDHEDMLHPQALEIMLSQNADVSAVTFQPIAPDIEPVFEEITSLPNIKTYKNPLFSYLAKEDKAGNLTVWAKLYKKEVIKDIFFNEELAIDEDCLFNFYALRNAKEMISVPLALHYFVSTPTSVSRSTPPLKVVTAYLTAIEIYHKEIKDLNNKFAKDIYKNRIQQCLKTALKKMQQCKDEKGVNLIVIPKIQELYSKKIISYKYLSFSKKWELFKV